MMMMITNIDYDGPQIDTFNINAVSDYEELTMIDDNDAQELKVG